MFPELSSSKVVQFQIQVTLRSLLLFPSWYERFYSIVVMETKIRIKKEITKKLKLIKIKW